MGSSVTFQSRTLQWDAIWHMPAIPAFCSGGGGNLAASAGHQEGAELQGGSHQALSFADGLAANDICNISSFIHASFRREACLSPPPQFTLASNLQPS